MAIGIAATLQGFGGGINASNNGGSFLGGFAKGALIGGATAAATAGIGIGFGHGIGAFGTELARAGAHGVVGGIGSAANGGSFGSGFLGSAVSSGFASGLSGASGITQYAGGALLGGTTNAISGGNFFIGAGQGLAITALNHNGGCPPGVDCSTLMDIDPVITAQRAYSLVGSTVGSLASFVGDYHVRGDTYLGKNGNFQGVRIQGWNQYTGTKAHMNRMVQTATVANRLNRGIGALGAAANFYNLGTGQINGAQFSIEMTSTGISTYAPAPISIPWTIGYEGLGRNILGRTTLYKRSIRPWVRRNVWGIND